MMEQKFKVRIVYDEDKLYKIQYAHYRFIPNWSTLHNNYHIITPLNRRYYGKSYIYLEARFTRSEAKEAIKKLTSIEDIEKIYDRLSLKIMKQLNLE